MERSRSTPPGSYDMVNPWWSQRLRDEVALRHKRPENLPVPFDEDMDGLGPEDARVESAGGGAGRVGKGRGLATGRMFVTPPSRRSGGRGGNRRSDGQLPEEQPSEEAAGKNGGSRTMGPVPPEGAPPRGPPTTAGAAVPPPHKGDPDSLQRAFEAEMVLFLREQNAKLQEEVKQLQNAPPRTQQPQCPLRHHGRWLTEVWVMGHRVVALMLGALMNVMVMLVSQVPVFMVVALQRIHHGEGALLHEGFIHPMR